jgi:hypothetical protein
MDKDGTNRLCQDTRVWDKANVLDHKRILYGSNLLQHNVSMGRSSSVAWSNKVCCVGEQKQVQRHFEKTTFEHTRIIVPLSDNTIVLSLMGDKSRITDYVPIFMIDAMTSCLSSYTNMHITTYELTV